MHTCPCSSAKPVCTVQCKDKPEGDKYGFSHFALELCSGKGLDPLPSDSRRRADRHALHVRPHPDQPRVCMTWQHLYLSLHTSAQAQPRGSWHGQALAAHALCCWQWLSACVKGACQKHRALRICRETFAST